MDENRRPASYWQLEEGLAFLNHGSFGACPLPVLDEQASLRARMEREPVRFFVGDLEALLDDAAASLARFVGANPENLVFVPNATSGVNAVLRSMQLEPGDELLTTDHDYQACVNTLRFVAERAGARVVVAQVPFPIVSPAEARDAILDAVTDRTRLALLSHITSPTGLIMPLREIVDGLRERGVESLVDGAHAPGMLPLDIDELDVAYYTGNCHKWICAPKGAGFLHVRPDLQNTVRPTVISHGAGFPRPDRSRFRTEFGWTGTQDPTAYLSVPAALRFMGTLLPGGWDELRRTNRDMALTASGLVCESLGIQPPAPAGMIGSLVALPIPDGSPEPPKTPLYSDPLQEELVSRHNIQLPVLPWPAPPRRLLRLSAQVYNQPGDYERLARALPGALAATSP